VIARRRCRFPNQSAPATAARTTGDVEHTAVRPETKIVGDLSLLGGGAPPCLPKILAVYFAPHLGRELAVEVTIMADVEVEPLVPPGFVSSRETT
jgi:hypothetical protein